MHSSCYTCSHKDVCLKRGLYLFQLIAVGRDAEVPEVKDRLDLGADCKHYEPKN